MAEESRHRDGRDDLPRAVARNPNARNPNARDPLPESPWLCPVCGDSHMRGAAYDGRYPAAVVRCGNGHAYVTPGA